MFNHVFPSLTSSYLLTHSASGDGRETARADRTESSSCEEESAGAQLMPYSLPCRASHPRSRSLRSPGVTRAGAGSGGGDKGNPFNDEVEVEDCSTDDGSQSDSVDDDDDARNLADQSPSCLPLSIAVTDFHFLVLARVYSQRAKSKSKPVVSSKSDVFCSPVAGRRVEGERRTERSSKTRYKRSSGYYLIAMSRLDGSLSQCVDLTPHQASSSIARLKPHSHSQVTQHSGRPLSAGMTRIIPHLFSLYPTDSTSLSQPLRFVTSPPSLQGRRTGGRAFRAVRRHEDQVRVALHRQGTVSGDITMHLPILRHFAIGI